MGASDYRKPPANSGGTLQLTGASQPPPYAPPAGPPAGAPPAAPPPATPYQSDQSLDPSNWAKIYGGSLAYGVKGLVSGLGNALSPVQPDFSKLYGLQDSLAAERAAYQGAYNPAIGGQSIGDLVAASHGATPSAAEIQLQKQSGMNEANQFGLAAALQGRNPGAALRSARLGSLQTQAQTNIDSAMLRAKEQADARNALSQALAQQRQQDLGYQQSLLQAQTGVASAGANAQANTAAAQNAYKGSLLGGGASVLGAIFSDRRLKKDVKPANLVRLANSIKGLGFRYKDKEHGEGQRVGVMAQDVAKGGPIGRRMVNLDGAGRMKLDVGNALGAALAMSAEALRKAS